jgi:hypothetical protein
LPAILKDLRATLSGLEKGWAALLQGDVPALEPPTHSEDFTSVNWYGTPYRFKKGLQAASVGILWEAWQNGTPSLSQETIGARVGSDARHFQLAKVFRRRKKRGGYSPHPALGKMIQSKDRGTYQLVEPDRVQDS